MSDQLFYIEEEFKGDIDELIELFLTEYSINDPICNYDHLKWQYAQNPHGPAIISCARENKTKKLVGVYIVNPVMQWINGTKYIGALSLNTFTHKEHRGKGMFTLLAKNCYKVSNQKGVQFIIGFPNKMSYGGFVRKLGFTNLGTIPYLIKPLNYFNLARNILLKSLRSSDISSISSDKYDEVILIDSNSLNQLDTFFDKHRKICEFQTYRTASHYRWRFFENPTNNYQVFVGINSNSNISSVLVLKTVTGVTNDVQIVDFCCLDEKSGTTIINFLLKEAKSKFSIARSFAQRETKEFQVLEKNGFFRKDIISRNKAFLPFIYKNLEEDVFEFPFDKWHISFADTDVV